MSDSHRIRLEGPSATVRWGWRLAATLGAWTYEDGFLSAAVVDADPISVTQAPLVWVIPRGELAPLRRYLEGVTVNGNRLTAKVGHKAER